MGNHIERKSRSLSRSGPREEVNTPETGQGGGVGTGHGRSITNPMVSNPVTAENLLTA